MSVCVVILTTFPCSGKSKYFRLFLKSNDQIQEGEIDFSCIETITMMYPTILWFDMMRKDLTYIKSKVFDKYDLATQYPELVVKTGLRKKRNEKADIATVFPSWADLVGDDPVLSSGILRYVTSDCTPSKKQLLPKEDLMSKRKNNSTAPQPISRSRTKKSTLDDLVEDLKHDLKLYHETVPANNKEYTSIRRALVGQLFVLVDWEVQEYRSNQKNSLYHYAIVWRLTAYFFAIFHLVGRYSKRRFENMVSFIDWMYDAIVDTHDVRNSYLVRSWKELNTAIIDHVPPKLINGIKKKKTETGAKIDTPQQVFNSLKEFNLSWATPNVHIPFVNYVQKQVTKKRVDIGHNLYVWPPSEDEPTESNDNVDVVDNVGDEPTEINDDVDVEDDHDDAELNNSDNENDSERIPMEGI
jgi:hypothetical protein